MATLCPEPTSSEKLEADEPKPPHAKSHFSHTPSTMTQPSFGSSRSAFTIALPCAPKRGAVLALVFLLCFHLALGKMCKDFNLEQATAMASVVVSGTVKKVMYDHDNSLNETRMFMGQIEIKRVFKGEEEVDRVAQDVRGTFRVYKNVVVEGFGDPKICQNLVKERETKIFMLNLSDDGQLKLNSSIIPLTLNFLDYVDAVVHDLPYTATETPQPISPCYLYFCPFGAVCQVGANNQRVCSCQHRCSDIFTPVCGTDGATYVNPCMLSRTACLRGKNIQVKHQGACGVRDPCEGWICKFGAECMSSMDGQMARCQCPAECPSYGDSVGSKPVCGNDGNDYANMCELRKTACLRMEDIRVKYYGKCDPCEGHVCESPKICQINAQREPECRCSFVCPSELSLVCGTDGRTYSNQCLLRKQACKSRKEIRMFYAGKCSPENNPCSQVQCGPEEECTVDRSGRPTCVCPPPCEPVLRRVCGNDSTTYDNECELRRASCLEKIPISVRHPGPCGFDTICHDLNCRYGSECKVVNGKPKCVCPQCTEEFKPVCGDNSITYGNECKLRQENCQREEHVKIKKEGSCDDGCGKEKCEFYAVCETIHGEPRCVCPQLCNKDLFDPVCGNDGITYDSECHLRVEGCQRKKLLTIASRGTCDKCKDVKCENYANCENGMCVCPLLCTTVYEPVCGSDGRTYRNECELRKYSCAEHRMITMEAMDECDDSISGSGGSGNMIDDDTEVDSGVTLTPTKKPVDCNENNCVKFGGSCILDGTKLICSCSFQCEAKRQPVCGSDGRMHGNNCTMLQTSCHRKMIITEKPLDECDEIDSDEPCDGKPTVMNPLTHRDYDCNLERCPVHSYCHTEFGKCCKEVMAPITHCIETEFKCCQDGVTPAKGPNGAGCPDVCVCNPFGSYSTTCDPKTKQCTCKPGVGGKKCDRCETGYWGLHKIADSGNAGCIPCSCSKFGSYRDDCDQMTGRCMCKSHIMGMKCDRCFNGKLLGPDGCRDDVIPQSCSEANCQYGATCRADSDGSLGCFCDHKCDTYSQPSDTVCGSDGQTFGSRCQLEYYACRLKMDITVVNSGPCRGLPPVPVTTVSPVNKSRKTTRHIENKEDNKTQNCTGSMIDNLCLSNIDCCPKHSHCKNGLCYCMDGYVPSDNNQQCHELVTEKTTKMPDTSINPCSNNPCHAGTCLLDDSLGYRCACPLGKAGPLCNRDIKFYEPSFSGVSYLELRRIDKATQDTRIEIIFTSTNDNGILLFNAKNRDGSGDFISLAVIDGFVEFRFDLGAGPATIKSRDKIERGKPHHVAARRIKEVGHLIVDKGDTVVGNAPSSLTSLELNDPLYLGFVPNATKEVYDKIGVRLGLVGCISSLRAGSQDDLYTYNLAYTEGFSDIKSGVDINSCVNNPCKDIPCDNGGTCLVIDSLLYECRCREGYRGRKCEITLNPCASQPCEYGGSCVPMTSVEGFFCQCAHGREGTRCERESKPEEVYVSQFIGDSYMELPVEEKLSSYLSIEIWFMANKPSGLLLLITQNTSAGVGDFVALYLEEKNLVFAFNLGSGIGRIESKKHVHLDKWHNVTISLTGRSGQMSIDKHSPLFGEAQGKSSMLNIDNRSLFLGGFNKESDVPVKLRPQTGFTGAIQRIIINGRTVVGLMSTATTMRHISPYNGPPCNVNLCLNGGACVPKLYNYECRCPKAYIGEKCETPHDHKNADEAVQFDGSTFLNFANEIVRKQEGQQSNRFTVTFRTTAPDGILLLQQGGENVNSDYLSLAVARGKVELSYNLGKQTANKLHVIRSTVDVADGQWHTVEAVRQQREGSLKVDYEEPVVGSSEQGTQQLDTDGNLWVGGKNNLPLGLPTMSNFKGCIKSVEVNGQQLHLVRDRNGQSSNIVLCT